MTDPSLERVKALESAITVLLDESTARLRRALESNERQDATDGVTLANAATILLSDVQLETALWTTTEGHER